AAHADPRATPIGFDHQVHDRDVNVSGAETIACSRCHVTKGRAILRPDHASCFGTCHGGIAPVAPKKAARLVVAPDQLRVCTSCHAEAALALPFTGALPVAYPPYVLDPDFAITIGHKRHRAFACATCHVDQANARWRL